MDSDNYKKIYFDSSLPYYYITSPGADDEYEVFVACCYGTINSLETYKSSGGHGSAYIRPLVSIPISKISSQLSE